MGCRKDLENYRTNMLHGYRGGKMVGGMMEGNHWPADYGKVDFLCFYMTLNLNIPSGSTDTREIKWTCCTLVWNLHGRKHGTTGSWNFIKDGTKQWGSGLTPCCNKDINIKWRTSRNISEATLNTTHDYRLTTVWKLWYENTAIENPQYYSGAAFFNGLPWNNAIPYWWPSCA
jgi:hypothetical protein